MKFLINNKFFTSKIKEVDNILFNNNYIKNSNKLIKLILTDKNLIIYGSNNTVFLKLIIDQKESNLKIKETGEIALYLSDLKNGFKKLYEENIEFIEKNTEINLISGFTHHFTKKEEKYALVKEEQFNTSKLKNKLVLPFEKFSNLIKNTFFAANKNKNYQNEIFSGINFFSDGKSLYTSATDSFRLSKCTYTPTKKLPEINITVDYQILEELSHLKSQSETTDITLFIKENYVYYQDDKYTVIFPTLSKKYPDISAILKKSEDYKNTISFDIDKLIFLIQKLKEVKNIIITVDSKKNNINLSSSTFNENKNNFTEQNLEKDIFKIKGISVKITLSAKYLYDAIQQYKVDKNNQVTLSYMSDNQVVRFENPNFKKDQSLATVNLISPIIPTK